MKKIIQLSASCLLAALLATKAHAAVSIDLSAGVLTDSGNSVMQDLRAIVLVSAGSDGVFDSLSNLSTPAFVHGDDIVVAKFALDHTTAGLNGAFTQSLTSISLTGGLASNQLLKMRWFPTTLASASAPISGASYGEFRASDWLVPADGALTVSLEMLTLAAAGELDNSVGQANLTVANGGTIPEPSTYALLGGLLVLGLAGWRRRICN